MTGLVSGLACLNDMLTAIEATNEYLKISSSLCQALGLQFATLLDAASYLVTFSTTDEPALLSWRCMTAREIGKVSSVNPIPPESDKASKIVMLLAVGMIIIIIIIIDHNHHH